MYGATQAGGLLGRAGQGSDISNVAAIPATGCPY
ncbi:MAG: hypothetical protein HQM04_00860 [Magnetococcales bacterium]|nr:hypothetical protein [Magnetococcales bacterium]MBF0113568.1 hypothetical protein [Magnetococcales bacterium]